MGIKPQGVAGGRNAAIQRALDRQQAEMAAARAELVRRRIEGTLSYQTKNTGEVG